MPAPRVPQHHPVPVELDDLELLLDEALDAARFNEPDSPVTLTLPDDVSREAGAAGAVELVDAEGLPLAQVAWPDGSVSPLAPPEDGPFRRLRMSPADYRTQHHTRTLVPISEALTFLDLTHLATLGPLALLALTGHGTSSISPVVLARVSLAAASLLPDALVLTTPLASHGDPTIDQALRRQVVTAYSSVVEDVAQRPSQDLPNLDAYPPEIAAILRQANPPPDRQGLVVFFTGLSGSGKSTLARALVDRVLEQTDRSVTSLDGDVVRRQLSSGLGFSSADRETNIRRIGWVAAEVSRHGGVAVVSPIAPFAETRDQVREMVEAAGGGFFLVHVATPLAECERRDRKGLYARARAGEIADFTGISSPYENPTDAAVRVDTTGRTIPDALDDVLVVLRDRGYLDLSEPAPPQPGADHVRSKPSEVSTRSVAGRPRGSTTESATTDGAMKLSKSPGPFGEREPLHVLYVCTANVCRSPTLELMSRHAVLGTPGVEFSSAGTHAVDGHPIDDGIAALLPEDVDPTHFRSHRLTLDKLRSADLVITAQSTHRTFILDDYPELFRKVFTLGQLAVAFEALPPGLPPRELLALLGDNRGSAHPELDVSDPYRQGPAAAKDCVTRLESLLDVVLPRLLSKSVIDG